MSEMLMEDYIREQINKGQYGVIVIPISTAEDIAYYIENSRDKAKPVRHGRWIRTYGQMGRTIMWECSECHEGSVWRTDSDIGTEKYCYNCGAKMEED